MQVTAPDRDQLRRLAELRQDRPVVLSLYLNLDPAEFATPPARATAVGSLLDEADRRLRERDGLSPDDRHALRRSLARARMLLERDLPTEGAQAVAVFASEPPGLFEALRLPRPVANRVAIGRSPLIGPLARLERRERWCVALVSRRDARIFRGSPDGLREIEQIHDEVFGQHDRGGWSQARFQRGIEKEKDDHLRHTVEALMAHLERASFQRLILGGPREVVADLESKLHGYLAERLAGRIDVDVDHSSPEQVLAAAQPRFEEAEREREAARAGAAGRRRPRRHRARRDAEGAQRAPRGGAAARRAVRRRRQQLPGLRAARSGRPAHLPGRRTRARGLDDLTDAAIELAFQGAGEILAVRERREEFEERAGGIAALLRF